MNKPIFQYRKRRGRPPKLQLRILKRIIFSGQMSKTQATVLEIANYGDVSDAMDALSKDDFIRFSGTQRKHGSRKHHRLYKVTEKGLRFLLETKLTPEAFWKAITLLCFFSNKPLTQDEFNDYYLQFERDFLGHYSIHGYFFLTHLFEDVFEQWLQTHDAHSLPLSQKVMECLAFNGQLTIEELIDKTGATNEDIIEVINNYSIQEKSFSSSLFCKSKRRSRINVKKNNTYYNFITHILIVTNKSNDTEKYDLSLFGVLLAIAFIRHHHVGIDSVVSQVNTKARNRTLFYQDIDEKQYYDIIVQNYKEKIPLIFGKWEFLKATIGHIMLYDGFHFLIRKKHTKSHFYLSIGSGGNKEYYDDVRTLTYNAVNKLTPVFMEGDNILKRYEEVYPSMSNDPRMTPVYRRINDLRDIFDYARITTLLEQLRDENSIRFDQEIENLYNLTDIKKIENIFRDELSLHFYLNLNTIFLLYSKPDLMQHPVMKQGRLILPPRIEEELRLGATKQRLMAILTKDKDIKEWFSAWIESVIFYRKHISDQMLKFYSEVIDSHQNVHTPLPKDTTLEAEIISAYNNEFDITKICSNIESVYDHSNA